MQPHQPRINIPIQQSPLVPQPHQRMGRTTIREDLRQLLEHAPKLSVLLEHLGVREGLGREHEGIERTTDRLGSGALGDLEAGVGVDIGRRRLRSAPVGPR